MKISSLDRLWQNRKRIVTNEMTWRKNAEKVSWLFGKVGCQNLFTIGHHFGEKNALNLLKTKMMMTTGFNASSSESAKSLWLVSVCVERVSLAISFRIFTKMECGDGNCDILIKILFWENFKICVFKKEKKNLLPLQATEWLMCFGLELYKLLFMLAKALRNTTSKYTYLFIL